MSSAQWDDLKPRVVSAIVMAVVGAGAVWAGGNWFLALIAVVSGLMIWELARMVSTGGRAEPLQLGALACAAIVMADVLPVIYVFPVLVAPALVGAGLLKKHRAIFIVYAVLVLLGSYGFLELRQGLGLIWIVWLLLVVVATDIAGYTAGRLLGGPKFWPRVSPKKTWSGTVAGWFVAALTGYCFSAFGGLWGGLAGLSVLVSFASQLGDIAESVIKRKCGVKDSSNLIPGHGGVLDRFDGMLGASVLVVLLVLLAGFPPGAG